MRIISLSPSVTEILFAIGVGGEIIANTSFCDYPVESIKIAKLGSFIYVDDEKIAALKPDLVITSTVVQNQALARYKKYRHVHLDPRSLDDIYDNILLLGKVTDHLVQSKRLIASMKHRAHDIRNTIYDIQKRIYIEEWFDPPMASGNWVPDIVRLVGGAYFPGIKKGEISRAVTDEEIRRFDPEVIFVSYCGFKDKSDPKKILTRPGWDKINAIKNNRVFVLNDDLLNRPGPRVLDAAYQIQKYLKLVQILSVT